MRQYYVYILSSRSHRLYIGLTSNLAQRLFKHRNGTYSNAFTGKYRINRLVYFETTNDIWAALNREKELKGWLRSKKLQLIGRSNPNWRDLAP